MYVKPSSLKEALLANGITSQRKDITENYYITKKNSEVKLIVPQDYIEAVDLSKGVFRNFSQEEVLVYYNTISQNLNEKAMIAYFTPKDNESFLELNPKYSKIQLVKSVDKDRVDFSDIPETRGLLSILGHIEEENITIDVYEYSDNFDLFDK